MSEFHELCLKPSKYFLPAQLVNLEASTSIRIVRKPFIIASSSFQLVAE